jgi:hypothetical protein
MTPIERLAEASQSFNSGLRAHIAAMRSMQLLRSSVGLEAALQTALAMSKGFPPEFNSADELLDLREELDWLKDEQFEPLRRNCLLGVCASFENCLKVAAAALSFGPNWAADASDRARLEQDCDVEFRKRFDSMDKEWRGKQEGFLLRNFPQLKSNHALVLGATEAIWVRNQVAHNAGRVSIEKVLPTLKLKFQIGNPIELKQSLMGICVSALVDCSKAAFKDTPYLDAY